jgi:hypothetical protein
MQNQSLAAKGDWNKKPQAFMPSRIETIDEKDEIFYELNGSAVK